MDKIKSLTPKRVIVYILGLVVLGLGITLNTKTNLGVSPIVSVPYNIGEIVGIKIGIMTFVHYCLLIFIQFLMLRKKFPPIQLLQILASFITSLFIQIFSDIIPVFENMVIRFIVLILAIVVTSIGVVMTVNSDIVPNPADGLAKCVGDAFKKNLGLGKNFIDFVSIIISSAVGLIFARSFLGIGIGTVITVVLTGRVIALIQHLIKKIKK